jgi:hypothetical protein
VCDCFWGARKVYALYFVPRTECDIDTMATNIKRQRDFVEWHFLDSLFLFRAWL